MFHRRVIPLWIFLLGLGIAATAVLGPLVTNTIHYRFSANMENQTIGGDAVLLLVVTPVLLASGYLWLRSHWVAPLLAIASASFASYTFLGFILIPDYARYEGNNENYYPLFVAVLALGTAVSVASWAKIAKLEAPPLSRQLRWATAGVLLLVSLFVGLTWSRQIADVMAGNHSTEYLEHPAAFWLIRTLDFAFVIPAALATAVGLLRGNSTAARSACALAGFFTLMLLSIVSMALVLVVKDDPSAEPFALLVLVPATVGIALLTRELWTAPDDAASFSRKNPTAPQFEAQVQD